MLTLIPVSLAQAKPDTHAGKLLRSRSAERK